MAIFFTAYIFKHNTSNDNLSNWQYKLLLTVYNVANPYMMDDYSSSLVNKIDIPWSYIQSVIMIYM